MSGVALRQRSAQRWLLPSALALMIIAADQLAKGWAVAFLGPEPYDRVVTLGAEWLRLLYSQNTGVAFSLFQGMPTLFTFTSITITTGAILAYIFYLPNRSTWVQTSFGLIVGGAVGNIVDRVRLGYVVDFISVGWWPVFNLADSAITVGVVMLSGYLIFVGDEQPAAPRTPPRDDGLLSDLLSREPEG